MKVEGKAKGGGKEIRRRRRIVRRRRKRRRRRRGDIHPCHWQTITSVTVRTEAEFLWRSITNCMLL